MNVKEFIEHYLSIGGIDFDGAYSKQCTDLFRAFHRDMVGGTQPRSVHGAKDFWTNYKTDPILQKHYKQIINTPEYVPQEGDVVIWRNGEFGHIAIATGEGDTKHFKSLDQNWKNQRKIAIVEHTYGYVYGCLRLRVQSSVETMKDNLLEFLGVDNNEDAKRKLIEHLGEKDKKCGWGSDRGAGHLGAERYKNEQLREDLKTCQETKKVVGGDLQGVKDNFEKFVNGLVYILNPNPGQYEDVSKQDMIEIEIKNMIVKESQRDKKEKELQQAIVDAKEAKKHEIEALNKEMEKIKAEHDEYVHHTSEVIEKLEARLKAVEKEEAVITQENVSRFKQFVNKIKALFNK